MRYAILALRICHIGARPIARASARTTKWVLLGDGGAGALWSCGSRCSQEREVGAIELQYQVSMGTVKGEGSRSTILILPEEGSSYISLWRREQKHGALSHHTCIHTDTGTLPHAHTYACIHMRACVHPTRTHTYL